MRIGYHAAHEQYPPSELLRLVRMAEEAGFDSVQCSDHFRPWSERQGHSGHAWSWLGAALQATSLPFGVVAAPGYRQHPLIVAQAAATLAEMFPGRFNEIASLRELNVEKESQRGSQGGYQELTAPLKAPNHSHAHRKEIAMLSPTTKRVEWNTPHAVNEKLDNQLQESISRYIGADRRLIDQRLRELDREWNIERLIEAEAPNMIMLGITLGILKDRKWFALSVMAAGMVLLHNTQGWYPLLPIFRRLGLRSQNEIEQERNALRVLRGDHEPYQTQVIH